MTTTVRKSDHAPRRVELPDGFVTWLPSNRRAVKPISDRGVEILVVLAQHGPLTSAQIAEHLGADDPRGRGIGHCCATMMCRGQIARWASEDLRVIRWRALEEGELQ